jgi:hypothetical protein
MTATVERPPVRRGFVVALLLVLPFLAHAVWDYIETRRLNARVETVARSGAPITMYRSVELGADAARAERYYRAASVLAGDFRLSDKPEVEYRLSHAMRDAAWTPAAIDELRSPLEAHDDALALVDRAAPLPFDGFATGSDRNRVVGGLHSAAILCEARAVVRASAGDADGAVESIYSEVRLWRAGTAWLVQLPALKFVLQRTTPSAGARRKLANALQEFDRDDRLAEAYIRQRAALLSSELSHGPYTPFVGTWAARPWMLHRLNAQLDVSAELIEAARKPSAERAAAIRAVGRWPFFFNVAADRQREFLESELRAENGTAERLRCARRLLAGETTNCQP